MVTDVFQDNLVSIATINSFPLLTTCPVTRVKLKICLALHNIQSRENQQNRNTMSNSTKIQIRARPPHINDF